MFCLPALTPEQHNAVFRNVWDNVIAAIGLKFGGFPEEMFVNLLPEEKNIKCNICFQVPNDIRRCFHRHQFCRSCLLTASLTHTNKLPLCPVCQDYILFADGEVDWEHKVLIRHKTVCCPTPGCSFRGPLHVYLKRHGHGRALYYNRNVIRCCVDRLRAVVSGFVDTSDSDFYRASPVATVVETNTVMLHQLKLLFLVTMCLDRQQYYRKTVTEQREKYLKQRIEDFNTCFHLVHSMDYHIERRLDQLTNRLDNDHIGHVEYQCLHRDFVALDAHRRSLEHSVHDLAHYAVEQMEKYKTQGSRAVFPESDSEQDVSGEDEGVHELRQPFTKHNEIDSFYSGSESDDTEGIDENPPDVGPDSMVENEQKNSAALAVMDDVRKIPTAERKVKGFQAGILDFGEIGVLGPDGLNVGRELNAGLGSADGTAARSLLVAGCELMDGNHRNFCFDPVTIENPPIGPCGEMEGLEWLSHIQEERMCGLRHPRRPWIPTNLDDSDNPDDGPQDREGIDPAYAEYFEMLVNRDHSDLDDLEYIPVLQRELDGLVEETNGKNLNSEECGKICGTDLEGVCKGDGPRESENLDIFEDKNTSRNLSKVLDNEYKFMMASPGAATIAGWKTARHPAMQAKASRNADDNGACAVESNAIFSMGNSFPSHQSEMVICAVPREIAEMLPVSAYQPLSHSDLLLPPTHAAVPGLNSIFPLQTMEDISFPNLEHALLSGLETGSKSPLEEIDKVFKHESEPPIIAGASSQPAMTVTVGKPSGDGLQSQEILSMVNMKQEILSSTMNNSKQTKKDKTDGLSDNLNVNPSSGQLGIPRPKDFNAPAIGERSVNRKDKTASKQKLQQRSIKEPEKKEDFSSQQSSVESEIDNPVSVSQNSSSAPNNREEKQRISPVSSSSCLSTLKFPPKMSLSSSGMAEIFSTRSSSSRRPMVKLPKLPRKNSQSPERSLPSKIENIPEITESAEKEIVVIAGKVGRKISVSPENKDRQQLHTEFSPTENSKSKRGNSSKSRGNWVLSPQGLESRSNQTGKIGRSSTEKRELKTVVAATSENPTAVAPAEDAKVPDSGCQSPVQRNRSGSIPGGSSTSADIVPLLRRRSIPLRAAVHPGPFKYGGVTLSSRHHHVRPPAPLDLSATLPAGLPSGGGDEGGHHRRNDAGSRSSSQLNSGRHRRTSNPYDVLPPIGLRPSSIANDLRAPEQSAAPGNIASESVNKSATMPLPIQHLQPAKGERIRGAKNIPSRLPALDGHSASGPAANGKPAWR